jgi:hypothetical protein
MANKNNLENITGNYERLKFVPALMEMPKGNLEDALASFINPKDLDVAYASAKAICSNKQSLNEAFNGYSQNYTNSIKDLTVEQFCNLGSNSKCLEGLNHVKEMLGKYAGKNFLELQSEIAKVSHDAQNPDEKVSAKAQKKLQNYQGVHAVLNKIRSKMYAELNAKASDMKDKRENTMYNQVYAKAA